MVKQKSAVELFTNPDLPTMANWICFYCIVVCPILWWLWIIDDLLFEPWFGLTIDIIWGGTITVILFVGGSQLRNLRPAAVRLIKIGLSLYLSGALVLILGLVSVVVVGDPEGILEGQDDPLIRDIYLTLLALLVSLEPLFAIASLIWLTKNKKRLPLVVEAAAFTGVSTAPRQAHRKPQRDWTVLKNAARYCGAASLLIASAFLVAHGLKEVGGSSSEVVANKGNTAPEKLEESAEPEPKEKQVDADSVSREEKQASPPVAVSPAENKREKQRTGFDPFGSSQVTELEGTWKIIEARKGKEAEERMTRLIGLGRVFEGNKWWWQSRNGQPGKKFQFRVNMESDPKQIISTNLTASSGPSEEVESWMFRDERLFIWKHDEMNEIKEILAYEKVE